MNNRKLFVPPAVISSSNVSKITKAINNAPSGPGLSGHLAKADAVLRAMDPNYSSKLADAAKNYAKDNIKMPTRMGPNRDVTGGSLVFKGSKRISEGNMSYALSKAPQPKDISINSNVKPNTYSNDYMTPVEMFCSPLHMSTVALKIPTNVNNPLSAYFANTICFDIQTRAQANVGFGLDVSTKLTATQLTTAFNAAIFALQQYFYVSSILSYESDSRNKNAGMIALRQLVSSQVLSDLTQLGRRLEDTPIPPRIVEWVRYMNGNHLSGDTQGAPLLKLCPSQPVVGVGLGIDLVGALSGLTSDANNTVFSLLRRAIPQWRVNTLYDCPPVPTFDKQFLTIFANLPAANYPATTAFFTNTVVDNLTATPYCTYTNVLDGVAFAMGGNYNSTIADFIPGLVVAGGYNTTLRDTRVSYYTVSGVKGFYSVVSYPFLSYSRQETNTFNGASTYLPHLAGTDKCQQCTGNAYLQTAQNVLDFLFNISAIPAKGMLTSFNRDAKDIGKI